MNTALSIEETTEISMDDIHPGYIVDSEGNKTSVILSMEVFQRMLNKIDDLAEDYELGKLVLERRSQRDQAIRVTLDDL